MTEELDLEELVAEVATKLEGTPHRVATLLTGSTATGTRRPLSDVDFMVILDDVEPWPVRVRDGGREAWTHESDVQIEVGYTSVSRLRSFMLAEAEQGSADRLRLLTDGRLIGAAAEDFEALRADAETRLRAEPPAPDAKEIAWECYGIWMRQREVEGLVAAGVPALLVADALFEQLVRLTCRLRGSWVPQSKHLFVEIADDDDVLGPGGRLYAEGGNDRERQRVLVELMRSVGEAFGLTFSGVYRSRPQPRT